MKKLLLASVFVAFALAVQAGDAKTSKDLKTSKDESPCCGAKTATSVKMTPVVAEKGKTACCSGEACKQTVAKKVFLSPKAAELARK